MTGRVTAYMTAIADRLQTLMPELKACRVIAGRFNIDELAERSFRSPAAFVGLLKSGVPVKANGQVSLKAHCAVYLVTEGREEIRDPAALVMMEAVIATLGSAAHWGQAGIGIPENISVEPVVSVKTRDRGVTLVAVTWQAEIRRIGTDIFAPDGVLYGQLYVNDELVVDEADNE